MIALLRCPGWGGVGLIGGSPRLSLGVWAGCVHVHKERLAWALYIINVCFLL
jgi:hypothetical protein